MRQTWMAQLILAISLCGMSLFILKVFYYSYAWFCSLSEGRTSFFCTRLFNRKLSVNSYFCFQLALLHSVSYFFSLYQSPSLPSCKVSDAISSNIDEVLLINLFPNVFVFVIHHKDWLTWWNWQTWWTLLKFFISNDLTQMVDFPTRIPVTLALLLLCYGFFLSSDATICVIQWLSLHSKILIIVVSVSTDFPSSSKLFLCWLGWSLCLFQKCSMRWYL